MYSNILSILTIISFLLSSAAQAQTSNKDSLKAIYEKETILMHSNGICYKYVKNNKLKRIGWMGNKLKKELVNPSDTTQKELSIFTIKMRNSNILGLSGIGSIIVLAGVTIFITATLPGSVFVAVPIFFVSSNICAAINKVSALKHLEKGIWLYNRDVILR